MPTARLIAARRATVLSSSLPLVAMRVCKLIDDHHDVRKRFSGEILAFYFGVVPGYVPCSQGIKEAVTSFHFINQVLQCLKRPRLGSVMTGVSRCGMSL